MFPTVSSGVENLGSAGVVKLVQVRGYEVASPVPRNHAEPGQAQSLGRSAETRQDWLNWYLRQNDYLADKQRPPHREISRDTVSAPRPGTKPGTATKKKKKIPSPRNRESPGPGRPPPAGGGGEGRLRQAAYHMHVCDLRSRPSIGTPGKNNAFASRGKRKYGKVSLLIFAVVRIMIMPFYGLCTLEPLKP